MHRRLIACLLAAASVLALATPALASRKPTRKEAAAIKKAFFRTHAKATAKIDAIRVSTRDRRFASVRYGVKLSNGSPTPATRTFKTYAYTKTGAGGKARTISPKKIPKGVLKDLGRKAAKSEIRLTGAYEATLTGGASCTRDGDFYTMGLYDKARDIYFDIDVFEFHGTAFYPLRQVGSVAGVAIGNMATTHTYETTWGEADVPKGQAYIDRETRGGVISATMGPQPPPESDDPSTFVNVDGYWECR